MCAITFQREVANTTRTSAPHRRLITPRLPEAAASHVGSSSANHEAGSNRAARQLSEGVDEALVAATTSHLSPLTSHLSPHKSRITIFEIQLNGAVDPIIADLVANCSRPPV